MMRKEEKGHSTSQGMEKGDGRLRTDEEDGVVLGDVIDGEGTVDALEENTVCLAGFERGGRGRCAGVREEEGEGEGEGGGFHGDDVEGLG